MSEFSTIAFDTLEDLVSFLSLYEKKCTSVFKIQQKSNGQWVMNFTGAY